MNLQQLRFAVEVEKYGTITKAAEKLFMVQPNLSKAIKELEHSLNIQIFMRTSRGMVPTRKGSEFLRYAKTILEQVDAMEKIFSIEDKNRESFRVCFPRESWMLRSFAHFVSLQPKSASIHFHYREGGNDEAVTLFEDPGINLGIIRYALVHEDFYENLLSEHHLKGETLREFQNEVLISRDHPWAKKKLLKEQDLQKGIEILQGDSHQPSSQESTPKKVIYVYDRASHFDLLREVKGSYLITSPTRKEEMDRNGLVSMPLPGEATIYRDQWVYREDRALGSLEKDLMEILCKDLNI